MRRAALLFALLSLAACGGPSSHRVYRLPSACGDATDPEEAERCAAWLVDELITGFLGVYEDPELVGYVRRVGRSVAEHAGRDDADWTFRVLDDPGVQAFAAPGGHVYVTRGLLAQLDSEAELAAVLAHEVGHVAAGHTDVMLDKIPEPTYASADFWEAFQLARDDEAQADQLAVRLLRRAGYDPQAMQTALASIYRAARVRPEPSWGDRHPPLATRLALTARAADGDSEGQRRAERYLRRIEGLVVGRDPRHGVVVDGRFVHARGGFSFALPEGWSHQPWRAGRLRSQLFSAWGPEGAGGLLVLPLANPNGELLASAFAADLEQRPTKRVDLAGYDGVQGTLPPDDTEEVRFAGVGGPVRVVMFEGRDGVAYGLVVATPDEAAGAGGSVYREVLRSFEATEPDAASPRRLRLRHVAERTTLGDLARRGCTPPGETELLGLLNERDLEDPIEPGRTVKCIGS